jgi:peroxiredoxin
MKINILLFTACLALTAACTSEKGIKIKGTVTGGDVDVVYLEEMKGQRNATMVDSFILGDNGSFSFTKAATEPAIYRIMFSPRKVISLPLITNEKVSLTVNLEDESKMTYEVEGSKNATMVKKLYDHAITVNDEITVKYDELIASVNPEELTQEMKDQFMVEYDAILTNQRETIKGIIEENKGTLGAVFGVNYLDFGKDFDYLNAFAAELAASDFSKMEFAQEFISKVEKLKKVSLGSEAPDIQLQNPEGEIVPLSSLKGQYVLIDFWASWCKPCREENPNVVTAYNNFKGKNFVVYGVSLDKSKEAWIKAINDDKLTWPHVSDLQYWDNKAAREYMVNSIPANFLIDPNGVIVEKDLRGADLRDKLAEILG